MKLRATTSNITARTPRSLREQNNWLAQNLKLFKLNTLNMRYFLIAGERSGDLHTGNLAKALRARDPQAIMHGFGGEYMEAAGVKVIVHYNEMAVMGFLEVLMSLRKINRYLARCKEEIIGFSPDVIILVDYGGFNKRIAAWARKQGIKVFYYISPKVWAWNQSRAWKLKATVDRMFVILPFEKEFFRRFDWDVDYVGNPVLDAVKAHRKDLTFLERNNLPEGSPIIALLPGSRRQELDNIMKTMAEVVPLFPGYIFGVASIRTLDPELYAPLRGKNNVRFIEEDTYNLLQYSSAAVVTSGTATLETALFRVPQVVVYRTSTVSYAIARSLIKVRFISLVNLIADKQVVRELIQKDLNATELVSSIKSLMGGPSRQQILDDYDNIMKVLDTGSASENTARLMIRYLQGTH